MEREVATLKGPLVPISNALKLDELFQSNLANTNVDDRVAIIYEDPDKGISVHLTYATLQTKSNQLARRILALLEKSEHRKGNNDNDFVITICMESSEKLVITLLAIWKTGAAYLPLDVSTPVNRIEHIFKEVNPLLLITDQEVKIGHNVIKYNILEKESSTLSSQPIELKEKLQNRGLSQTAIILYTSGSTGVPKGVRLPHHVIANRLFWQWDAFPFDETEETCVFKTAITFVDAVSEIWAPLLYRDPRALLILPKQISKDPEKLLTLLNTYKVQRLTLVPSLLQAILMYLKMINTELSANENFLSTLKLWICSGEPLSVDLVERFFSHFGKAQCKLCNFYGSTEIMGDVSYYVIHSLQQIRQFQDKVPIGVPLNNTQLYLLNSNLELVKQREIGELFVSGHNLAAGYVAGRDPEKFIDNPFCKESGFEKLYKTGDFAKITDHVLLYEGRCDSQIKIRGQRVDLSEVQAALNALEMVQKSVVLCYKPEDINQAIIAFVILNNGFSISGRDIQGKLKSQLVCYAIPQIFIIDSIPLLNNGKVDRQKLLQIYADNSENATKNRQIQMDLSGIENSKLKVAKCLFETVEYVLGNTIHQPLSIDINFYDIGGNSLNCIQTITKLREQSYFISIADFISAANFGVVINLMQQEKHIKENIPNELDLKQDHFCKTNYSYEKLTNDHKDAVFKIITDSFYEKADLEQWLLPRPKRECYTELMEAIWQALVEKNLSFVVYSETDKKYVGACLNFDTYDEPEVEIQSNLTIVFDFLEYLEAPAREKLPIGKRLILHSFMMGTDSSLTAAQNIQIVTCMEKEILNVAEQKGFVGVFTTNTNALTQQLGTDVFRYQTLLDFQVNQYVTPDGRKPFAEAPDDQKAVCCWKPVS